MADSEDSTENRLSSYRMLEASSPAFQAYAGMAQGGEFNQANALAELAEYKGLINQLNQDKMDEEEGTIGDDKLPQLDTTSPALNDAFQRGHKLFTSELIKQMDEVAEFVGITNHLKPLRERISNEVVENGALPWNSDVKEYAETFLFLAEQLRGDDNFRSFFAFLKKDFVEKGKGSEEEFSEDEPKKYGQLQAMTKLLPSLSQFSEGPLKTLQIRDSHFMSQLVTLMNEHSPFKPEGGFKVEGAFKNPDFFAGLASLPEDVKRGFATEFGFSTDDVFAAIYAPLSAEDKTNIKHSIFENSVLALQVFFNTHRNEINKKLPERFHIKKDLQVGGHYESEDFVAARQSMELFLRNNYTPEETPYTNMMKKYISLNTNLQDINLALDLRIIREETGLEEDDVTDEKLELLMPTLTLKHALPQLKGHDGLEALGKFDPKKDAANLENEEYLAALQTLQTHAKDWFDKIEIDETALDPEQINELIDKGLSEAGNDIAQQARIHMAVTQMIAANVFLETKDKAFTEDELIALAPMEAMTQTEAGATYDPAKIDPEKILAALAAKREDLSEDDATILDQQTFNASAMAAISKNLISDEEQKEMSFTTLILVMQPGQIAQPPGMIAEAFDGLEKMLSDPEFHPELDRGYVIDMAEVFYLYAGVDAESGGDLFARASHVEPLQEESKSKVTAPKPPEPIVLTKANINIAGRIFEDFQNPKNTEKFYAQLDKYGEADINLIDFSGHASHMEASLYEEILERGTIRLSEAREIAAGAAIQNLKDAGYAQKQMAQAIAEAGYVPHHDDLNMILASNIDFGTMKDITGGVKTVRNNEWREETTKEDIGFYAYMRRKGFQNFEDYAGGLHDGSSTVGHEDLNYERALERLRAMGRPDMAEKLAHDVQETLKTLSIKEYYNYKDKSENPVFSYVADYQRLREQYLHDQKERYGIESKAPLLHSYDLRMEREMAAAEITGDPVFSIPDGIHNDAVPVQQPGRRV